MKKNTQYHSRVTSIYPGIYQPVFTKDQDMVKVKGSKPPVNILEFPDYYQIEMPAPGFQKDQFFIKTQGCSLLIAGYKKCVDKISEVCYHQQDFRCKYITINVDLQVEKEWLQWMKAVHIPEVMETGFFLSHRILRLIGDEDSGGVTYAVQYTAADMDSYERYKSEFAPALQASHTAAFKDKFVAFRTLLEEME